MNNHTPKELAIWFIGPIQVNIEFHLDRLIFRTDEELLKDIFIDAKLPETFYAMEKLQIEQVSQRNIAKEVDEELKAAFEKWKNKKLEELLAKKNEGRLRSYKSTNGRKYNYGYSFLGSEEIILAINAILKAPNFFPIDCQEVLLLRLYRSMILTENFFEIDFVAMGMVDPTKILAETFEIYDECEKGLQNCSENVKYVFNWFGTKFSDLKYGLPEFTLAQYYLHNNQEQQAMALYDQARLKGFKNYFAIGEFWFSQIKPSCEVEKDDNVKKAINYFLLAIGQVEDADSLLDALTAFEKLLSFLNNFTSNDLAGPRFLVINTVFEHIADAKDVFDDIISNKARENLALFYAKHKEPQQALIWYKKIDRRFMSSEILFNIGHLNMMSNDAGKIYLEQDPKLAVATIVKLEETISYFIEAWRSAERDLIHSLFASERSQLSEMSSDAQQLLPRLLDNYFTLQKKPLLKKTALSESDFLNKIYTFFHCLQKSPAKIKNYYDKFPLGGELCRLWSLNVEEEPAKSHRQKIAKIITNCSSYLLELDRSIISAEECSIQAKKLTLLNVRLGSEITKSALDILKEEITAFPNFLQLEIKKQLEEVGISISSQSKSQFFWIMGLGDKLYKGVTEIFGTNRAVSSTNVTNQTHSPALWTKKSGNELFESAIATFKKNKKSLLEEEYPIVIKQDGGCVDLEFIIDEDNKYIFHSDHNVKSILAELKWELHKLMSATMVHGSINIEGNKLLCSLQDKTKAKKFAEMLEQIGFSPAKSFKSQLSN